MSYCGERGIHHHQTVRNIMHRPPQINMPSICLCSCASVEAWRRPFVRVQILQVWCRCSTFDKWGVPPKVDKQGREVLVVFLDIPTYFRRSLLFWSKISHSSYYRTQPGDDVAHSKHFNSFCLPECRSLSYPTCSSYFPPLK